MQAESLDGSRDNEEDPPGPQASVPQARAKPVSTTNLSTCSPRQL